MPIYDGKVLRVIARAKSQKEKDKSIRPKKHLAKFSRRSPDIAFDASDAMVVYTGNVWVNGIHSSFLLAQIALRSL